MKADLSFSNVNESNAANPKPVENGSPSASGPLHPSVLNQQERQAFSSLPRAAVSPHMNPSYSNIDLASMSKASPATALPIRSTSMTFSPAQSHAPAPQPSMTRETTMNMDSIVATPLYGAEPRIFPGVVSRRTRKSSTQGSETGSGSPGIARRGDARESVAEEPEEMSSDENL